MRAELFVDTHWLTAADQVAKDKMTPRNEVDDFIEAHRGGAKRAEIRSGGPTLPPSAPLQVIIDDVAVLVPEAAAEEVFGGTGENNTEAVGTEGGLQRLRLDAEVIANRGKVIRQDIRPFLRPIVA